jgi:hypothetical protein
MSDREDWIAAHGPRPVHTDVANAVIADHVLSDPDLSLTAKALFALIIVAQGQPVNPYEDAYEDPADIAAAVDELVDAGLAVRVSGP